MEYVRTLEMADYHFSFLFHSISNTNSNNKIINQLDLIDGLKDLLIIDDLSFESIPNTLPADLDTTLGIDQLVAKLRCAAARKTR